MRLLRHRLRVVLLCSLATVLALTSLLERRSARSLLYPAPAREPCLSSAIAMGEWLQWPRVEPNPRVDPNVFPPAGLNLPGLLSAGRPPPPRPVRPWFPIPAAGSVESRRAKTLLILVKSSPDNAEARQAIRDTWGDPSYWHPGCMVRFVVGSPAAPHLRAEAANFGDIIVHSESDGYRNNTQKLLAGMAWALHFLPNLRLLLFTDDDILLNPFASRPLIRSAETAALSQVLGRELLAGHLVQWARPLRDNDPDASDEEIRKWAVSEREYPADRYPDYLSAGWLLVSAGLLPNLLWAAGHVTPRLPLDDVYLGLLAVKLRLPLVNLSDLLALDSEQSLESKVPEKFLALHGYSGSPERLRSDWQRLLRLHCGHGGTDIILTASELEKRSAKEPARFS